LFQLVVFRAALFQVAALDLILDGLDRLGHALGFGFTLLELNLEVFPQHFELLVFLEDIPKIDQPDLVWNFYRRFFGPLSLAPRRADPEGKAHEATDSG